MSTARVSKHGLHIEESINRVNHENDGKHYVNSPAHAALLLHQLARELASFDCDSSDDPLLYAYQLRDALPRWLGYMKVFVEWSNEVIDATPDQITESGAR